MISRPMKSHTNEHTVHGRVNTKGHYAERVSLQGLREINLRSNILSEFIKNHFIPNELSTGAIDSST